VIRRLYERSTDSAIISQREIDQMIAEGVLILDPDSPRKGDVVSGTVISEHITYRYIRQEK
jgi:hypothetical protein